MNDNLVPSDYSIPHDAFRTHQLETIHWAENLDGIGLCEQMTGSGKSAVAAAQAYSPINKQRVCVLTRTKALQDQYRTYGAHVLMGRSNYPCLHPEQKAKQATAEDCLHSDTSMHECGYYGKDECPYSVAKEIAMTAQFVCTNYSYWLASSRIRAAGFEFLVLDECQLLPDITLEWSGVEINEKTRVDWGLERFPRIEIADLRGIGEAVRWLEYSHSQLGKTWLLHSADARTGDEKARDKMKKCERLGHRVAGAKRALIANQDAWFIKSGPGKSHYRGRPQPGIVIRPLTARFHFGRLFTDDVQVMPTIMAMSATVGDFDTFAEELGINSYSGRKVPSRFPPESRKVYILDVPRLNYRSDKRDYTKQADAIAKAIALVPNNWSGIVHVTRKKEASLLGERLSNRGLDGRIWVPPIMEGNRYLGTKEQVDRWNAHRGENEGSIVVGWQLWEGYDGLDERINVTAKVPFPYCAPGSYEEARMKYSHRFYSQRTAWMLMQSQGRNRRGREEDYDLDGQVNGLNVIADGNVSRVKKYLSDDFRAAIVEL